MIDDGIDMQALDLPAQQLNDSDVVNIRDYTTTGWIHRAITTLGNIYTDSTALAEICHNTSSCFQTVKVKEIYCFFK